MVCRRLRLLLGRVRGSRACVYPSACYTPACPSSFRTPARPASLTSVPLPAEARETVYILDWWLSPELYLRRPPASNQQYRLDTMLKAAAERGVQVRVIVYKEVPQALTCKLLSLLACCCCPPPPPPPPIGR